MKTTTAAATEEKGQEPSNLNNNEQEEKEIAQASMDTMQDDDVFVEENVTPFYMSSGIYTTDITYTL